MGNIFWNYVAIPLVVIMEIIGVAELYPICKDSVAGLLMLIIGVYGTYEFYRVVKNHTI